MEDITGLGQIATAAASIANTFIDKISHAVGVIYNDSNYKIKKDSLKQVSELILQRTDLDEFTKLAMISNLEQDLKHYTNQRNIIQKAILNVDEDVEANNVDDDWLLYFFDKAKNVSSEEMQNVWAKMLSEEFNKPQSIPKSLLHTISIIDARSAMSFNKICQFNVEVNGNKNLLLDNSIMETYLKEIDVGFNDLSELEKYGLIASTSFEFTIKLANAFFSLDNGNVYKISCKKLETQSNKIKRIGIYTDRIKVGKYIFTNDGKSLFNAINVRQSQYMDIIIKNIYTEEYDIEKIENTVIIR